MITNHKVITGDSRNMSLLRDQSVQLVVTSPPYWQLKDYGSDHQIGFDEDYESYINSLNKVWMECYRILHNGCRLCINIGDQFARSVYYGRYKVIPIRTEIIKFCESLRMDYMGAIIWQKQTTMNTTGGGSVMGSFPYPRNGILKIDYEFILIFKKLGEAPKPNPEQKRKSELSKEEWNKYFSGHWNFGGARQNEHIAMFPEELPLRLIKMFSFYGETVCDPFLGSGTTTLAAMHLDRNSVGYEINQDYIPVIKKKLSLSQMDLFSCQVDFYEDKSIETPSMSLSEMPYIFVDPHKVNKKMDVKKLTFGSIIDSNHTERTEYYNVKEIINPIMLQLNNGLKIHLLGIKENPSLKASAVEFLRLKLHGQQVFLRFDSTKYDSNNNLLCYLYLKNKTFLNIHLLKEGLVELDDTYQFKYINKFKEVINERMA
ncbi:MAG: DNA methyltransferase [Candidatus Cloacimonadaceae bacterium]|nr:DNA methyltransferase [Candidatus Cloacimonadaceae bacterium]MDP3114136.1 DNA methyltransferase [Candidatus Cloacimonadaceae bacterium]